MKDANDSIYIDLNPSYKGRRTTHMQFHPRRNMLLEYSETHGVVGLFYGVTDAEIRKQDEEKE